MNQSQINLAITLGLLWAAYKYGPDSVRGLAMGAAGYVLANNVPLVQNGLQARFLAPAQAAA